MKVRFRSKGNTSLFLTTQTLLQGLSCCAKKVEYLSLSYDSITLPVVLEDALAFEVTDEFDRDEALGLKQVIQEMTKKYNSTDQLEEEEKRII